MSFFKVITLATQRLNAQLDARLHGYSIGRKTKLMFGAVIRRQGGGSISIGQRCFIHRGAMLLTQGGNITVGNNCSIHPYAMLYGQGGLTIGNDVRIATHVIIIPANHGFDNRERPIRMQPETSKGITIGDDVWLGAGAKVLDGVTVATGCVIGAGAVVTKSTEPYGIYAGVPARKIGERGAVKAAA